MRSAFPSALRALELVAIALWPASVAAAPNDAIADRVLGQINFSTAAPNFIDSRGLTFVAAIAVDRSVSPNRLYVSDSENSRILVWLDAVGFTNGQPADAVIGQPDFFTAECNHGGRDASTLCSPHGIAVDASGNLFVADRENNRVLQFNSPLSTDRIADRVYGQPDFGTGACQPVSAASLCRPTEIAVDPTGNLYVADSEHERILEYDAPLAEDAIADRVFGQPDFQSADCSSPAEGLCEPTGIAFDASGNLYVSDLSARRVVEYDLPLVSDTIVDRIVAGRPLPPSSPFPQPPSFCDLTDPNALCRPTDIIIDDEGALIVSDFSRRILVYDDPLTADAVVDRVVAEGDPNAGVCSSDPGCRELAIPFALAIDDGQNLYVADTRPGILRFDGGKAGDGLADAVLGQPRFDTFGLNFLDGRGFSSPVSVAVDRSVTPNRIYVSERGNSRILGWSNVSALENGAPADIVIGAPDFFISSFCIGEPFDGEGFCVPADLAVDDDGNLFVADTSRNKVLGYLSPFTTDSIPDLTIGAPNRGCEVGAARTTLCNPGGLAVGPGNRLFVSDTSYNRVLVFDRPFATDASADLVLGQPSFSARECATGERLCGPQGLTVDAFGNLYVADTGGGRVVRFDAPTAQDADVDATFGEEPIPGLGCGTLRAALCIPIDVAVVPNGTLWVTELGTARVLAYADPLTSDRLADGALGSSALRCTRGPNSFCGVSHLASDAAGNLYVVDPDNRVLIFDDPIGNPVLDEPGLGFDTLALYDSESGTFFVSNDHESGPADFLFRYGPAGQPLTPLAGDWNGDGVASVALFDSVGIGFGTFFLRETNNPEEVTSTVPFGAANASWIPLAGDWNGDGIETIGLYDPPSATIFLRDENTAGVADVTLRYGPPFARLTPLTGDWDGDGIDTIGLYDAATGEFFLRNSNDSGVADLTFQYGPRGAALIPLAGDWNGDGIDTIGLVDPERALVGLRNSNDAGFADLVYFGGAGQRLITGNWDGR